MKKSKARPVTLQANKLVLTDMEGKVRALLDAQSSGFFGLHLFGPDGAGMRHDAIHTTLFRLDSSF